MLDKTYKIVDAGPWGSLILNIYSFEKGKKATVIIVFVERHKILSNGLVFTSPRIKSLDPTKVSWNYLKYKANVYLYIIARVLTDCKIQLHHNVTESIEMDGRPLLLLFTVTFYTFY